MRILQIFMISIVAVSLMGCSFLTPKEKIRYISPEPFIFALQDVQIQGNIEPIKPFKLDDRLRLSEDNKSVIMGIKTWLELRENSKKRRELNFMLYRNLRLFVLGYKQYENDIKKYIEWSKKND